MSIEALLAILVGIKSAVAVRLMMERNMLRFLFGLVVLGNAINLLLFTAGRLADRTPAFVPEGAQAITTAVGNALPQALILTAIVIGFALATFMAVLVWRAWREMAVLDPNEMRAADEEGKA